MILSLSLVDCSSDPFRGNEPREGLDGYNVVVILADALRADHLGAYGYHRPTSPFLDRLASEGVVFKSAISPSTYTAQAVASLFSGMMPSQIGVAEWRSEPPDEVATIGEQFREAGYETVGVSPTPVLEPAGFKQGMDWLPVEAAIDSPDRNVAVTRQAVEVIGQARREPLFLYVHYFSPHDPYEAPDDSYARLGLTDRKGRHPLLTDYMDETPGADQRSLGPGSLAFEDSIAGYDALVRDVDDQVATIFRALDNSGMTDKTIIVFLADHGEEFLEHGFLGHAHTLYQEVTHVPLIIWAGERIDSRTIERNVSTADVAPTLLYLTGARDDSEVVERNLLTAEDHAEPQPIFSELLLSDRAIVRSVVLGDWKYHAWVRWLSIRDRGVLTYNGRSWLGYLQEKGMMLDFWGPVMKEELFHLASDPGERIDLINQRPEVADRLRSCLDKLRSSAREFGSDRTTVDAEQIGKLRSLGYIGASGPARRDANARLTTEPSYEPEDVLEVNSAEAEVYLPYGWGNAEPAGRWTDGRRALIWFRSDLFSDPIASHAEWILDLESLNYGDQVVHLYLNGRRIGELWPGVPRHQISIPPGTLAASNRLVFHAPLATPRTAEHPEDPRAFGAYVHRLRIRRAEGS